MQGLTGGGLSHCADKSPSGDSGQRLKPARQDQGSVRRLWAEPAMGLRHRKCDAGFWLSAGAELSPTEKT